MQACIVKKVVEACRETQVATMLQPVLDSQHREFNVLPSTLNTDPTQAASQEINSVDFNVIKREIRSYDGGRKTRFVSATSTLMIKALGAAQRWRQPLTFAIVIVVRRTGAIPCLYKAPCSLLIQLNHVVKCVMLIIQFNLPLHIFQMQQEPLHRLIAPSVLKM